MSLAISSLSLLPAFCNALFSFWIISSESHQLCSNRSCRLGYISCENTAAVVQNLPKRPKFHLSATAPCLLLTDLGLWRCEVALGAAGHPKEEILLYYMAISELMKKLRMGKMEMLQWLHSSTRRAMRMKELLGLFEEHQSLIARAWQERCLHLLRWALDDDISKFKMSAIKKNNDKDRQQIPSAKQNSPKLSCFYGMHFTMKSFQHSFSFSPNRVTEFQGLKTWMVSREHPALVCVLPASLTCWCSSAQPANISSVELHLQLRTIS